MAQYDVVAFGSSQCLRGARYDDVQHRLRVRIIPAPAGSTPTKPSSTKTCRDHPRACGEHARTVERIGMERGSSPRLRGAPITHGRVGAIQRIIPASAGSTR